MFRRILPLLVDANTRVLQAALPWAAGLQLPVHALALGTSDASAGPTAAEQQCSRAGVPWQWQPCLAADGAGVTGGLLPADVLVADRRGLALVQSWQHAAAYPTVYVPASPAPVRRVVVVQETGDAPQAITLVADLCTVLRAELVVLTVAPTERLAAAQQQQARAVLAGCDAVAEFDCVIGWQPAVALRRVAQWRRCDCAVHVARPSRAWWRRGGPWVNLADGPVDLNVLALSAGLFAGARVDAATRTA